MKRSIASPAVYVGEWLDFLLFQLLQSRCENSPSFIEFVISYKIGLRAREDVQQEALIGVRQFDMLKETMGSEFRGFRRIRTSAAHNLEQGQPITYIED